MYLSTSEKILQFPHIFALYYFQYLYVNELQVDIALGAKGVSCTSNKMENKIIQFCTIHNFYKEN